MAKELSAAGIDTTRPLYEQPAFDLLYLNPANNNAVLKLSPVAFPNRKVPQPLPRSGYLEIELFDRPGERYRVPWQAVVQLKLFEQILLEQATELIHQKRFDEAYDYLDYVASHYATAPGLSEVRQLFLLEEARAALSDRQNERAFADLCRLAELNPNHPELSNLLGQVVDLLVQERWSKEEYAAARGVVETLSQIQPQHAAIQKWHQEWQNEAVKLQKEVEAAISEGNSRQADRVVRKLQQIWPSHPGLSELIGQVRRVYPRFRVGVTCFSEKGDPTSLIDWSSRRWGRLVRQPLVEYAGPGSEGGVYQSGYLQWTFDASRRTFSLRLLPNRPRFSDGRPYTAFDLAQQLASRANPHHESYSPQWAEVVESIRVTSSEEVTVVLRFPHLKPEALLQCVPSSAVLFARVASQNPALIGAFLPAEEAQEKSHRIFLRKDWPLNSGGTLAQRILGPAEVEEILFPRGRDALQALRQGDIDIVDRINPWESPLVGQSPDIRVQPYRLPLIHMLVPNLAKPLPANRDFRRAMLYAINRERILGSLRGGKEQSGGRVISGPLPAGTSFGDPVGYGYDPQLNPREYQPALALALSEIAFRQANEVAQKRKLPPLKEREVVVVHPPHEIAREACRQIAEQWRAIGWRVKLIECPPDKTPPPEYDFLYIEAAIWEPEIDCPRFFNELFSAREFLSPQVDFFLVRLGMSADWPTLGQRLREFHRAVYQDVTVLPLWQLVDFYAYRSDIAGLENPRVSLYQDVETWQFVSQ